MLFFLRSLLWLTFFCTGLLFYSPIILAGTSTPFIINLSKPVIVTGTPTIALDVGGVTRHATYISGTGTASLTFTYDAVVGDIDLDGVSLTSPIILNGGTLKDSVGNDATLTFTSPNTANVKINYPSLGMDFVADADGRYTLNGTVYNDLSSFLTAANGTFTRNTVGTYYDAAGVLQTATANTPRFDYDPVTHVQKGILIEASRTNIYGKSSVLPSATNLAPTKVNNVATDPAGGTTADQITTTSTGSGVYATAAEVPLTVGTTYTFSTFIKYISGTTIVQFGVPNSFTNGAGDWYARYDFTTDTFSSVNANLSNPKSQDIGNGWRRISITGTVPAGGTGGGLLLYSFGSGMNLLMWGSQVEQGTYASSYIPTSTVAVTRDSDVLNILTSGSWFNLNETSLYIQAEAINGFPGSGFLTGIGTNGSNYFAFPYVSGGFSSQSYYRASGAGPVFSGAGTLSLDSVFKAAYAYSTTAGTASYVKNGNAVATANGVTAMASANNLKIGSASFNSTIYNAHFLKLMYYPTRMADTQLLLLTQ